MDELAGGTGEVLQAVGDTVHVLGVGHEGFDGEGGVAQGAGELLYFLAEVVGFAGDYAGEHLE